MHSQVKKKLAPPSLAAGTLLDEVLEQFRGIEFPTHVLVLLQRLRPLILGESDEVRAAFEALAAAAPSNENHQTATGSVGLVYPEDPSSPGGQIFTTKTGTVNPLWTEAWVLPDWACFAVSAPAQFRLTQIDPNELSSATYEASLTTTYCKATMTFQYVMPPTSISATLAGAVGQTFKVETVKIESGIETSRTTSGRLFRQTLAGGKLRDHWLLSQAYVAPFNNGSTSTVALVTPMATGFTNFGNFVSNTPATLINQSGTDKSYVQTAFTPTMHNV